jgi:hypothetical protein
MKTIQEAYDAYDKFLDESGEINIFGMIYPTSRVFKKMDPRTYNGGFYDFLYSLDIDPDDLEE